MAPYLRRREAARRVRGVHHATRRPRKQLACTTLLGKRPLKLCRATRPRPSSSSDNSTIASILIPARTTGGLPPTTTTIRVPPVFLSNGYTDGFGLASQLPPTNLGQAWLAGD